MVCMQSKPLSSEKINTKSGPWDCSREDEKLALPSRSLCYLGCC